MLRLTVYWGLQTGKWRVFKKREWKRLFSIETDNWKTAVWSFLGKQVIKTHFIRENNFYAKSSILILKSWFVFMSLQREKFTTSQLFQAQNKGSKIVFTFRASCYFYFQSLRYRSISFWYSISFCCVVQNILFQFTCSQYSLLCCRLGSIYIRRSCINADIVDIFNTIYSRYSRYVYNTIYSRYIQYNITIYNFSFFHLHELMYIIKAEKRKGYWKEWNLGSQGLKLTGNS